MDLHNPWIALHKPWIHTMYFVLAIYGLHSLSVHARTSQLALVKLECDCTIRARAWLA